MKNLSVMKNISVFNKDDILETIGIEHIDSRLSGFFPNGNRKCDNFSKQLSRQTWGYG